jgi:hypothetical protein
MHKYTACVKISDGRGYEFCGEKRSPIFHFIFRKEEEEEKG